MATVLRVLRVGALLSVIGAMLLPCSAVSMQPVKYVGHATVSFEKNGSALSDPLKVQLARHLPRIRALHLEIILVIASGDSWDVNASNAEQISLSIARANAVRQFFLDAGIPERRIYAERQSAPYSPGRELFPGYVPPPGTALVEYIGPCGYGNAAICKEEPPDAQPIVPGDAAR